MFIRRQIKKLAYQSAFPKVNRLVKEYKITDFYNSDQIQAYQYAKLQKLLEFSYNHVPYWHDLMVSLKLVPSDFQSIQDLNRLPILTKDVIWHEGKRMWADTELDKVKTSSTSGSSGQALVFRKNKTPRDIEQALMIRYKINGGINPCGFSVKVWGGHSFSKKSHKEKIMEWIMNERNFNTYELSDQMIDEIIDLLKSGNVVYLRGYTSAIYMLAQAMLKKEIHLDVPFISVTAEKLYDYQREVIKKAMGNNLFDQYGCGECGAIAYECNKHNGLHQNFEHSILEVLNDNNEPATTGRVIITNLDNYAMPLIRYENGDVVTLSDKKCDCGRNTLLIEKIEGRKYDIFHGEDGKMVHAGFLDDVLLDTDFLQKYGIKQLQIIQKELTSFVCKYISDSEVDESDILNMQNKYRLFLGKNISLQMKKVDIIPAAQSGKRHFIIPMEAYKKNPQMYD